MKFSKEPNLRREPKLSEQVADFLAGEISSGHLEPGTSLPSEAELAYRFNVSRTVIREALARLKSEGYISSKQGRRSKVSKGADGAFRLDSPRSINLIHLYELRALLEGDAAALAATRRTRKAVDNLAACLATMAEALKAGADGTSANFDFHRTLVDAGANDYLSAFIAFLNQRFWDLIQSDEDQIGNLPLTPDSLKEHAAIFETIVKKEPAGAREAVHRHLINSAKRRGITINLA
jgi:GntR family transcriptional regulator, transcriptional repressor for pyruvate dehydrogenase complex